MNVCERCRHKWESRRKIKPKVCPKCKSPYWDKPKKKINKEYIENYKTRIILLHNMIIKKSGGEFGIRDDGGLYHASYKILKFNQKNKNDPYSVGAMIYQDLAKRHYFVDGNKRISHCWAKIVLIIMGYHLKVNYKDASSFIIQIARYKKPKSFKEIKEWVKKNSIKIEIKNLASYLKELYFDITNENEKEIQNE